MNGTTARALARTALWPARFPRVTVGRALPGRDRGPCHLDV